MKKILNWKEATKRKSLCHSQPLTLITPHAPPSTSLSQSPAPANPSPNPTLLFAPPPPPPLQQHHPTFSYVPPQVSTGPPATPSFRLLPPQAPHFSSLLNPSGGATLPSLAYQNLLILPPGVSFAAAMAHGITSAAGGIAVLAPMPYMQPMMLYQAPRRLFLPRRPLLRPIPHQIRRHRFRRYLHLRPRCLIRRHLHRSKELVAVHVDSDAKFFGSMNDEKHNSGFSGAYGLLSSSPTLTCPSGQWCLPQAYALHAFIS
ncbi:hypothetical protein Ahy_A10g049464 [Arachis hypogaea]|uniref:Uncharacterized protein n=1 Tax=Arachis hypogaea TaxID=3818 RepID=A0A445B782_ARAHY|nr:hypothetical protein Ahy_A10g049464 [Arachis hypogaea]